MVIFTLLGFDEYKNKLILFRVCTLQQVGSIQQIQQERTFVHFLHPYHLENYDYILNIRHYDVNIYNADNNVILLFTFWVIFSDVEPTRPTARKT